MENKLQIKLETTREELNKSIKKLNYKIADTVDTLKYYTKKQKLFSIAQDKYGEIHLLKGRTFDQCFNVMCGKLYFWFDDNKGSSHTVHEEIK